MKFEVLHNGVNIVDYGIVSACCSSDRYGGMLDDLTISFASENNTLTFNKDDKLIVRTENGFTTGTMHLDSYVGKDGRFAITGISCRHENKKRKSRIWNYVRLMKIIGDVAANTGLTPKTYGVKDYTYASVAQIMETDLEFLVRICKREGYSIKCDNGNLIVFNEYYIENSGSPITISKSDAEHGYSFNKSVNGLASMTVKCFDIEEKRIISYTARDDEISGGEDAKLEFMTQASEAERFAKGYLRAANKFYITGELLMPYNGGISAGTVADLKDFEDNDGRYVVYEVRHDFVNEKTIIKVRKVLAY